MSGARAGKSFFVSHGCLRAALLLAFAYGGAAFAQPAPDPPAPAKSSLKLTTVVLALSPGTPYLKVTMAPFCIGAPATRVSGGDRQTQAVAPYATAFRLELERAGYKSVTAEDNLFGQEDGSASDYQVGAVITDMRVEACMAPTSTFLSTAGDARGKNSMTIDWQVYSPLKKQVVARITTSGTAVVDKSIAGGYQRLVTDAFASNARSLIANAEFQTAMNAARPASNDLLLPGKQDTIALSGSLNAAKLPVSEAVGSVVTLRTGSASGSGVLVSDDGYLITNAHVVGDEKEIRARWSDGIETVAQVIRVAKDRDIALVKTNPRDRSPLPIKRGVVTPGQRVFAIGSPRGQEFQGTVSSGVVSASRLIDGMRYIQSDVSVSPGSSGGALLDESGSLIGITVAGVDNGGRAGLNLFIPVGDAMDFLSLETH
jgi:serine protease Do